MCDIHLDKSFCAFTGCKRTVLSLQCYLFMTDFPPSFILIRMVCLTLVFEWTEFIGTSFYNMKTLKPTGVYAAEET